MNSNNSQELSPLSPSKGSLERQATLRSAARQVPPESSNPTTTCSLCFPCLLCDASGVQQRRRSPWHCDARNSPLLPSPSLFAVSLSYKRRELANLQIYNSHRHIRSRIIRSPAGNVRLSKIRGDFCSLQMRSTLFIRRCFQQVGYSSAALLR